MSTEAIKSYWSKFQQEYPKYENSVLPSHFYFCDNKVDADDCAYLVSAGIKQATTHSLDGLKMRNEALPKVGDLAIVTDWEGNPKGVIQTSKVEIVKYKNITAEYAAIEGEGDKSLAYWQQVHWAYYTRELSEFNVTPTVEMDLVCEYFETIYA